MYSICSKQRINLSRQAEETIRYDIECFAEDSEKVKFGGAVNRIFRVYCHRAQANISAAMSVEQRKLETLLASLKADDEAKKELIMCLLEKKEQELTQAAMRLAKKKAAPNPTTLYVQDDIREYLESSDVLQLVGKHYKNTWQYIKAVIEEYAEKPYIERESIFFDDIIHKIKYAGENRQIVSSGRNRYLVRPYGIETDTLSTYNYLVGYSSKIRGDGKAEASENLASFRIARISNVVALDDVCPLSAEERDAISNAIIEKGVQFLVGDQTEIKVRLTENGLREYKKQITWRPMNNKIKSAGNELVFFCTEWQALIYFFKFGKEVEIISPDNLRSRFQNMHSEAAMVYGSL